MSKTIESTIKTLTEFEAQLDGVKGRAAEARKGLVRNAGEWAEAARSETVARAQRLAEDRLAAARTEAGKEVKSIQKTGQASLEALRQTMANHKEEAVQLVVKRLIGGRH
jgi:vacuolar-type H+-ATPase subunit H